MKAILTTIAVLFFSTLAMAQNVSEEAKVETISFGITVEVEINEQTEKEVEVARLYRFKNSRIKKELAFRTKRNRSKLA
ncbi:MAG: hypothetical protein AAF765_07930 [Bacteroidota bacterium]|nr:hypothetical protein [uncultured Allomuricauda sp.]